jgi:hypothetical protein
MTRKTTLLLLLATGTGWLTLSSYNAGPGNGGLGDRSSTGCGSPGAGCHADNSSATQIVSHTLVATGGGGPGTSGQYTPGATYTVSLIASNQGSVTGLTHFGFQTTARTSSGANAGSLSVIASSPTHTYSGSGRTGIEHHSKIPAVSTTPNFYQVTFLWTAPPAGTGPVTFFSAVNLVNNNGNVTGDQPNIGSTTFQEGPASGLVDLAGGTTFAIYPNPAKEQIRIDTRNWQAGDYNIAVISTTGTIAMQRTVRHTGAEAVSVLLPDLSTGLYVVRVQGGGQVQSSPLFIR